MLISFTMSIQLWTGDAIFAFYYMLRNIRLQLRSKLSVIQLLLVKYENVKEFGIDKSWNQL